MAGQDRLVRNKPSLRAEGSSGFRQHGKLVGMKTRRISTGVFTSSLGDLSKVLAGEGKRPML